MTGCAATKPLSEDFQLVCGLPAEHNDRRHWDPISGERWGLGEHSSNPREDG